MNERDAVRAPLALWLLLAVCLSAPACTGGDERPDVLFITVDTLRADRLGAYGYRLDTSPNIDSLAARGVRFTDCTVPWPMTSPSIAAMMTGFHPKTTGLGIRLRAVPTSLTLVSELFAEAGFRTAAVVANFNVGKTFGYHQGFERFVESWQEKWQQEAGDRKYRNRPGRVKQYTNATIVNDHALEWMRSIPSQEPFFLWLHYVDPHGPYAPPAEYRSLFPDAYDSEPLPLAKVRRYQIQFEEGSDAPIADLAHYRAQYDREIRYLDDEIGRLFEQLERLRPDRRRLTVFTADHGESLGEHQYYLDHGRLSYQPTARVPAIVVLEGTVPAGRTIEQPVGLIDISRTLLELAGIQPPSGFEGSSLVDLIRGGSGGPEYVFMESGMEPERPQRTVRRGRWKLIQVSSPADRALMTGDGFELYDVHSDPGERNNLASEHPEIVAELTHALIRWVETGPRHLELGAEIDIDSLDETAKEMLRALGYLEPED